jgi:hypothetical protein
MAEKGTTGNPGVAAFDVGHGIRHGHVAISDPVLHASSMRTVFGSLKRRWSDWSGKGFPTAGRGYLLQGYR